MQCSFAPMEGITGRIFRSLYWRFFGGVDRYFTPFLSPNQHHVFSRRELGDVLPEGNAGVPLVPQILTRRAGDFLWCAGELAAMGYREVNLNCGCPSGTVVARGKGAGMLEDLGALAAFLDRVFAAAPAAVSVKTRLGLVEPEEFDALLDLFGRYPLAELIIHLRVRRDFYRGTVRRESFARAAARSALPLCWNGDLRTVEQCREVMAAFPRMRGVMIGRGLLADPALARKLRGGAAAGGEELRAFHDELYEAYCRAFASEKNALRPMKELWTYLIRLFPREDRLARALRKCRDGPEFRAVTGQIFRELPVLPEPRAPEEETT